MRLPWKMNLFTHWTFNTGEFKAFHNIHIVVLLQSQLCIRKSGCVLGAGPSTASQKKPLPTMMKLPGRTSMVQLIWTFQMLRDWMDYILAAQPIIAWGWGGFHAQKTFFTISPQFISKTKADASPQTSLCTYKIMNTDKANAIWKHPIIS